MKKRIFISLFVIIACLALVGCKKEDNSNVKTLECSAESQGMEISMVIKQSQNSYKITEVTMDMNAPKSLYKDFNLTDEELKEMMCQDDDNEYKSCKAEFKNDNVYVNIVMDPDKYTESIKEDQDMKITKLDKNTLTKIKEFTEESNSNYKCEIK